MVMCHQFEWSSFLWQSQAIFHVLLLCSILMLVCVRVYLYASVSFTQPYSSNWTNQVRIIWLCSNLILQNGLRSIGTNHWMDRSFAFSVQLRLLVARVKLCLPQTLVIVNSKFWSSCWLKCLGNDWWLNLIAGLFTCWPHSAWHNNCPSPNGSLVAILSTSTQL